MNAFNSHNSDNQQNAPKRQINATQKPKLHSNANAPLSPYIIHLSHEEEAPTKTTPSHLQKLAQSLIIDQDFSETEPAINENELSLNFEEIVHQFTESDTNVEPVQLFESTEKATLQAPPTPSEFHSNKHKGVQIHKALFSQETIEENSAPAAEPTEPVIEVIEEPQVIAHIAFEDEEPIEQIVEPEYIERHGFIYRLVPSIRLRAVFAFVLLSFAFILPLHAIQQAYAVKSTQVHITDSGKQAIDQFMQGTSALGSEQLDLAEGDFAEAAETFKTAEESLQNMGSAINIIASILPQTERAYKSATGLITAGKEISSAASLMTRAANEIQQRTSISASVKLTLLTAYIENALPHLTTASEALANVDANAVPEEYKTQILELQQKGPALERSMKEFVTFSDALTTILGSGKKMRYLVIFQNNTELRATGGFPGSFAEIDVLNGEIVNVSIPGGGTYDVQGQLSQFVEAPQPLSLLNDRWEFHDSTWFPDFPTSAQKLLWFYEHAGGPTVDGVIAINATVMPDLLQITGPIEMPEYSRVIDSENFLFETQKIVEIEHEQFNLPTEERPEEAPKQFIGDLAPKVLEQLKSADMNTTLSMLALLGQSLEEKDVLIYMQDNELQSDIEALNWSGKIKQAPHDYLMVVNTNLGGGKTDTVIDQTIDVLSEVQKDGSIINTVTITKEHRGLQTTLFEGVNNVDYIRLYVPKGSELLGANGFEIPPAELFEQSTLALSPDPDLAMLVTNQETHEPSQTDIWVESGKTVFGNWIQTKPGEVEVITFTYKLPQQLKPLAQEQTLLELAKSRLGFKDLETHTFFLQKQPGVETRTTTYQLVTPSQKQVLWTSGENNETRFTFENTHDALAQLLIENVIE